MQRPTHIPSEIPPESKKKNILFLISSIGGGGAERVACRLVSEFVENNNVYLMYFQEKENTYYISPKVNLISFSKIHQEYINKGCYIKNMKLLRIIEIEKIRRKYNINITISFLHQPNILNVTAGGCELKICSERNDPEGKGIDYFNEMTSAYEKADKVVFQTNYSKNKYSFQIRNKSVIIPNPICVTCLADKRSKKKIVGVGRLVPQKNHELLIKSFSIFHKIHNEYILEIYGIGPLLDELKLLVKQLGLKNYIYFNGFSNDVHEKIKDAEQFVFSSNFEGMPNALMEAMMMGLPCISTNCSGVSEIIEHEKNGILVEKGDVEGLAREMIRLCENNELREKIGKNAKIKAEEWKLDKIVQKWEALFD